MVFEKIVWKLCGGIKGDVERIGSRLGFGLSFLVVNHNHPNIN
jgi:hypothetical protein